MANEVDILIVGAGPAGLAAAIGASRCARASGKPLSVVVIDKAPKSGYHSLSGSNFEMDCLDELLPGWEEDGAGFVKDLLRQTVHRHDTYFLTRGKAIPIPRIFVPGVSKKDRNATCSMTGLTGWLRDKATGLGAEVYYGFSATEPIIENGIVKGVMLHERGVGRDGDRKGNYFAAEAVRAKVTILADGVHGPLSGKVISKLALDKDRCPQVYSIGVKNLVKVPDGRQRTEGRVVHTFGYPNKLGVFGGGFVYEMSATELAVGLVIGLDWPYFDLVPQQELELFKQQPLIAGLLAGGEIIAAGAKMIPEGGFYAMPQLHGGGVLLAGDSAGMVNLVKLKGIHLAIRAGMSAGEAAVKFVTEAEPLAFYDKLLEERGVIKEIRSARNMRQCFATPFGLLLGAPMTMVQNFIPLRLGTRDDRPSTRHVSINRNYRTSFDRKAFAAMSGTMHDENLLSHIRIPDNGRCLECIDRIGGPCTRFCPAEVYTFGEDMGGITVSATDCLHCMSCTVKCPMDNIEWQTPEGTFGPRYRRM